MGLWIWLKFHHSQEKHCCRAWECLGSDFVVCMYSFSVCRSDWKMGNGAHQHKPLLRALQQGQHVATGMHRALLFLLCWETYSTGAVCEWIHLSVWCQLYCRAPRHWEICGIYDTDGPYMPLVGLIENVDSCLTLPYSISTTCKSFWKVRLAFKEKTLRQTWY